MRYHLPPQASGFSAGSLSSMIDIIFLLIIFFVVTASFDREQIDSKVSLPAVDSAAIKTLPQDRLMLNVLKDGSVRMGFQEIPTKEVTQRLGQTIALLKNNRETVLIVNGDRDTPHKYISAVMNAAARAGYSQVRINAEVKAEARP